MQGMFLYGCGYRGRCTTDVAVDNVCFVYLCDTPGRVSQSPPDGRSMSREVAGFALIRVRRSSVSYSTILPCIESYGAEVSFCGG